MKVVIYFSALIISINVISINAASFSAAEPNTTYCYAYVGCFDNNYPFDNTRYYLPNDPENINTEFLLFTRKNRNNEQILSYRNTETVRNSNFNKNLPLKIIVHGFGNTKDKPWMHEMKDAFLDVDDYNVIITGWGDGATFPYYNNASTNIRLVGKELSLIVNIIRHHFYREDPESFRIHCIGHSLGAHLCGHAGNNSPLPFDRITGLDPANQFFEGCDERVRLDKSDAKFVDAIHTSSGNLLTGSFGIIMPVGHIDFYVNGGNFQPGCPPVTSIIGSVFTGSFDPSSSVGCSHNRVMKYWTESIKTRCSFQAFKCDSFEKYQDGECASCADNNCSILGFYADGFKGNGSYYLATAGESPYCGDQYLFEMKLNKDTVKTAGEIILDLDYDSNNTVSIEVTKTSDQLKPDTYVKKFFVSHKSAFETNNQIRFTRKELSLISSWISKPYEPEFYYDKIRLVNTANGKIRNECVEKSKVESGISKSFKLEDIECNY